MARSFFNLIDNAIKYTPEGGKISVMLENTGNHIICKISDTGIGIPEEHQPHIFERFYRVEKERVVPSSTGLGLAICRQIVERHGGSIRAEKGPGGRFIFTVPLAQ